MNFSPRNYKLWQTALAKTRKIHPTLPYSSLNFRHSAIQWYCDNGGKFSKLPADDLTQAKALIANLFRPTHEITASLMAHGLQYQWREYVGKSACKILVKADTTIEIKSRGFFGLNPTPTGYQILTTNNPDRPVTISRALGYTLLSLSRELSRRETKFRDFERVVK